MVTEVFGDYLGEIIIGATFIGVSWIFKGMMKEALIEFAGLVWDKERMKDQAVNQVLSIEANKWHGREVEGPVPEAEIRRASPLKEVPRNNAIEDKIDHVIDVVSSLRSEFGEEISSLSGKINSVFERVDDFSFRIERLENYNLTSSQKEEYDERATK